MYLSPNNTCWLNNGQETFNLSSKALLFEKKRKLTFSNLLKFKHWRLNLLLGTFTGAWCDSICPWSMMSDRLDNQRIAQLSHDDHMMKWPHYKIFNHFLAWKKRKWCWTEWSVSVAKRIVGLASWSNFTGTRTVYIICFTRFENSLI